METLAAINRWLAKQHVVTWCVHHDDELWCANAFYYYDPQRVAFYVLSEDKTRHAQMSGRQANVAGTVNGQPKTVALIRGVQFKGEIRRLERKATRCVSTIFVAFRLPPPCQRPCGRSAWMNSSSLTTR